MTASNDDMDQTGHGDHAADTWVKSTKFPWPNGWMWLLFLSRTAFPSMPQLSTRCTKVCGAAMWWLQKGLVANMLKHAPSGWDPRAHEHDVLPTAMRNNYDESRVQAWLVGLRVQAWLVGLYALVVFIFHFFTFCEKMKKRRNSRSWSQPNAPKAPCATCDSNMVMPHVVVFSSN